MNKQILLDGKPLRLGDGDYPILIYGAEGNGASLFSISVMADYYLQGHNILFLCGYHMARDEFDLQTSSKDQSILIESSEDIKDPSNDRVIFLGADHQDLFPELFDVSILDQVKDYGRLIISGDLDKASYKGNIWATDWKTKILFTKPEIKGMPELPTLRQYTGFLSSLGKEGIVSLAG